MFPLPRFTWVRRWLTGGGGWKERRLSSENIFPFVAVETD